LAANAVGDDDVSTAFQEALVSDWGDGVAAVEEALESASRLSHVHGSAMFFLAQEAGATQATVRLLSLLYCGAGTPEWDGSSFAEPRLIKITTLSMHKFLKSEEKDGHLIDPNVWRKIERMGKVALYCTSFAVVIVDILKIIESLTPDQFERHKQEFFPMICCLTRAQSEEIRHHVQQILFIHVAPAIGVEIFENSA
jgi:hypothetical protein